MGAELNAALAETPEEEADRIGQSDNRERAERRRQAEVSKKPAGEVRKGV